MLTNIIHTLKRSKGFVSGEELSRAFHMTRAGVWKHIEEMRALGYTLEAAPRHGYRLTGVPDVLIAPEVQFELKTRAFGVEVHHFDTVDSTMNEAFRLGTEGAPEGTVVVAEAQTKGRGRMGRVWSSPKGKGIYFSLLLRPSCAPSDAARLTLVAAVAVAEAVERVTGLGPRIKWPNDILMNSKKLCGILTEMRAELDRVQFVVVGVGVNVNSAAHQLIPEATSLKQISGRTMSRTLLFQEILRVFEQKYMLVQKNGFPRILTDWKARSATLGRMVRFTERGRVHHGLAVDLDSDGALLVKLDSGTTIRRIAGDVELV